ncbi:hypothetical protein [Mesorhizobium sp. M0701]|uniref:hypothetical protein n=1 Tax=Mesorhizobium sp. M0701 TaxID=2956989 RepID=UPI00333D4862
MFDPALISPRQSCPAAQSLYAIVLAMALSGLLGVDLGFCQTGGQNAPERPVRTSVPKTVTDLACTSGQRKVVEVYEDGVLVQTVDRGCKP